MRDRQINTQTVIEDCWKAAGGKVVLLRPQSKVPSMSWKDKNIALDILLEHIRTGGNYGIQTGAPSGFDVLDIDQPDVHPVLLDRLKAISPWTETGRGMHFWFRHQTRVCKNKSKVIAGIDVKTSGGYVVAPGSIHENGKEYVLYGTLENAPPWPEDLLDRLFPVENRRAYLPERLTARRRDILSHPVDRSHYVTCALKCAASIVRAAPQGERNATLNRETFSLAGLAHEGLERTNAEEVLILAAIESGLTAGEARLTFNSAWEKGALSPRTITHNLGDGYACNLYDVNNCQDSTGSEYTSSNSPLESSQDRIAKFNPNSIERESVQHYTTSDGEIFTLDEKHCVHTNNTDFDVFQGTRSVLAYNKQALMAVAKGERRCEPAPLFNHGGIMVHLSPDRSKLRPTSRSLYDTVLDGKATKWYSIGAKKEQDDIPSDYLTVKKALPRAHVSLGSIAKLLEGSNGLPSIIKIVNSPIFLPDGTLTRETGYYSEPGIWYESHPDFKDIHLIPAEEAVRLLLDEFLVDFPFANPSDLANAIANLLLMFMRDMIPGSTPLFVIEAPTPGTGKSLLVECFSTIAAGGKVAPCAFGNDDEELRKHLTARLFEGPQIIIFDNLPVKGVIDRPSLAAVLTSTTWSDRILGRSETVTLPTSCVWVATGNNIQWSEELARRIVRIRIVPSVEKPWTRKEFKHDPLKLWVQENRAQLAFACISIIQHWIDSGRPGSSKRLGSFEEFASTMGGVLENAGIQGFLENANDFMEQSTPDSAHWNRAFTLWAESTGSGWKTAKELLELLQEKVPDLVNEILFNPSPKSLGKQLGTKIDRVYGNHRLVSRLISGNRKYSLVEVMIADNAAPELQDTSADMEMEELF